MSYSESRIRVRYAETDQMGVAYYANYLVWMEVGRGDLCRLLNFTYKELEAETGVFFAVAEAQCRYKFPARYDDEVIVRTWVESANTKIVTIRYEMRSGERLLAEGFTKHIFVNREMRPCRLPEKYRPHFGIE